MSRLFFVANYTQWHYTRGLRDFVRNWMDFLWFLMHFFSIGILFRTLFSPWQRMDEGYGRGFNPSEVVQTFIINTLMRVVGFVIRTVVLIVGFLSLIVTMIGGTILMLGWLCLPFIMFFLLAMAVHYLFI